MTRPSFDDYFLALARTVSLRADCTRRKVGCVIVDQDHRVVATGYNGAAPGELGCLEGACPRGHLTYAELAEHSDYAAGPGRCIAKHAEHNALDYAVGSTEGATVYLTDKPCPNCAERLADAKIERVVIA